MLVRTDCGSTRTQRGSTLVVPRALVPLLLQNAAALFHSNHPQASARPHSRVLA
jgi:hypothetical protein